MCYDVKKDTTFLIVHSICCSVFYDEKYITVNNR